MKKVSLLFTILMATYASAQIRVGESKFGKAIVGASNFSPAIIAVSPTAVCALPGSCGNTTGCPIYIFTGEGDWRIPGNWAGGNMPPTELPNCYQIIINPASNKSVLVSPQTFYTGSKLHVMPGKTLIVPGNVFMQ